MQNSLEDRVAIFSSEIANLQSTIQDHFPAWHKQALHRNVWNAVCFARSREIDVEDQRRCKSRDQDSLKK